MAKSDRNEGDPSTRPTNRAFIPASAEVTLSGKRLGWICVGIGALAIGMWLYGANSFMNGSRGEQENAFYVLLVGPLAIPIGIYFFVSTAKRARFTKAFDENKKTVDGIVTHAYKQPKMEVAERYSVAYSFEEGPPAVHFVTDRQFKEFAVGQHVQIEYLPQDPKISRLAIDQAVAVHSKRK